MIYMGYDAREDIAYRVAKHSFEKQGIQVKPLVQKDLRDRQLFTRPWRVQENGQWIDERSNTPISTEFSFSRFLTPIIAAANNDPQFVLFIDCDMLCVGDVFELFKQADSKYAVQVVKHDYKSSATVKMDKIKQAYYSPKKLWSSVILWNTKHPANKLLSPGVVNHESGKFLHEFQWLQESEIGELDSSWNFIPYHSTGTPNIIHWTEGGPWFEHYKDTLYAKEWQLEKLALLEKELEDQRDYCKLI
tara:strand:- start:2320 stop:3060 length:741 start_codon:yes stop_codon:yes gene_type:complete